MMEYLVKTLAYFVCFVLGIWFCIFISEKFRWDYAMTLATLSFSIAVCNMVFK